MASKKESAKSSPPKRGDLSAKAFVTRLTAMRSTAEMKKLQALAAKGTAGYNKTEKFLGIRMGHIFQLAKQFIDMPLTEVAVLIKNNAHEARVGAVSIMDFKARQKKTSPQIRKELFEIYVKNHRYINHWGMVDRAAVHVVGGYLIDQPRDILYKLARSKYIWERRTAIVATAFFLKSGENSDTFKVAEMLVGDTEHFIHTAVGSWIRVAGEQDRKRLFEFLDRYAAVMPRIMLRFAVEKLDARVKSYYMKKSSLLTTSVGEG